MPSQRSRLDNHRQGCRGISHGLGPHHDPFVRVAVAERYELAALGRPAEGGQAVSAAELRLLQLIPFREVITRRPLAATQA